jgi:hypothetical protein
MALVVSGQVRHRHMQPDQVHAALRKHLPGLLVSAPDFAVDRSTCRVRFFCNTSSILDFTVVLKSNPGPAPAAVAVLARETEILNATLTEALGRRFRRAKVEYCLLEDERSRSGLLSWAWEPPLSSRPAKFSYILCFGLLILAGILVRGLLRQPPSASRSYNIISLILAICLPAFTLPLPFVFEHLKSRGNGRWVFSQTGGGKS